MSAHGQRDPLLKSFLRAGWRGTLMAHALASTVTSGGRNGAPRVFYGGARAGNVGGPLVKVKRLREFFPEHHWRYNLVYCLSNAPYLPAAALDWLRWRRVPVVLNQNGVFYPGWYDGDWKGQNRVMARAYHRADHVFWQSAFCRDAADRFLGERSGPGEVLYNAVDTRHFRPAGHRPARPFTFLVTGKIGNHLAYRLESTVAGLGHARNAGLDCCLAVAGWVESGARALLEAAADRHGVATSIAYLGPYTQEKAPAIYQAADAYVITKYLDPCPNTVLEALACGLPVLYSRSGGVPELVGPEGGVGLPVPEDWSSIHMPDAATIGEGMLKIAATAPAIAVEARRRAVDHFDIEHWIGRHRTVFERLLEYRT